MSLATGTDGAVRPKQRKSTYHDQFVESQPLFGSTMQYRIVDAKDGELERGELVVDELRQRQPWAAARA